MTQNATQAKKSRSFTVGVSFRLSPIITLWSSPGCWQHLTEGDNVDPSQLFLAQIRLPLHSLSKVQSPALTSQGFSAVHLFKTFRTSEISRKNPRIRVKGKVHSNASS